MIAKACSPQLCATTGDVIFAVFNTSRIIGLDAVPGLLLLAKKNIYIVDHFFQTANGELVDAWDSPEEVSSVPVIKQQGSLTPAVLRRNGINTFKPWLSWPVASPVPTHSMPKLNRVDAVGAGTGLM